MNHIVHILIELAPRAPRACCHYVSHTVNITLPDADNKTYLCTPLNLSQGGTNFMLISGMSLVSFS